MKKAIAGSVAGIIIGAGAMLAVPSNAGTGAPQCHLKTLDAWTTLLRVESQPRSHHPARALRHDALMARRTLQRANCI